MAWVPTDDADTDVATATAPPATPGAGGRWVPTDSQAIGPGQGPPIGVNDDPRKMASEATLAAASLPTDEMTRVRYLAAQRFPGLSPNAATNRYFWQNGRLAYRDDQGVPYYEEPAARSPFSKQGLEEDAKAAAGKIGGFIPTLGGLAGGALSLAEGPPGWLTGTGQAAAGAGVMDALRQSLAHAITGENKDITDRALQTGGEAANGAAGQVFNNALVKGLRFFGITGNTPAYSIPESSSRAANAKRFGIDLTPAEETGNRTLINRQRVLQNTAGADDTFANFYNKRNDQVGSAVNDLLSDLDPTRRLAGVLGIPKPPPDLAYASPRMGMAAGVGGAQASVKAVQDELRSLSKPLYRQALDERTDRFWNPDIDQLMQRPSMVNAIERAKTLAAEKGYKITVPTFENGKLVGNDVVPDWRSWDYIKKGLDQVVKDNTDQWGRVTPYGQAVQDTRGDLLGILDKANPDYKAARSIFSEGVPGRNAIEGGQVGDISKLENENVQRAGVALFGSSSSPEDVRIAKKAFINAGQTDQWDALAGGYLRQVFNAIPDTATGTIPNIGGMYRKAVFGSPARRNMIEAAFDHHAGFLDDFKNLMDTLDATSKATRTDSITAFAQQGQKQLQREANSGPAGVIPNLLDTVEFWNAPSEVAGYMRDLNTARYANKQAELFTTPEGRQTLKELKKLGPTSAGAVLTLSRFLTGAGEGFVSRFVKSHPMNGPAASDGATSTTATGPQP